MAGKKKEIAEGAPGLEDIPEIPKEEQPYPLPEGWKWVYLNDISSKIVDGSHNPPKDSKHGIPLLSAKNIKDRKIEIENAQRWIKEEDWQVENKRTQITSGDLLLTIVGTIGRVAIVDDPKFAIQRSVAVIRTNQDQKYLSYFFESPYVQEFTNLQARGTAQKGFYLNQLESLPCALPPLETQRRIVNRIEFLFSKLDEAAEKVQAVIDSHEARKQAILHKAFSGELTKNVETTGEDIYKDIPEIPKEEQPYPVPEGWKWVRLGEAYQINPKIYADDNINASFIPMANIEPGMTGKFTFEVRKWKDIKKGFTHFADGDIAFAKISPCFENQKSMIIHDLENGIGAGTTELIILRNTNVHPKYTFFNISDRRFIEGGKKSYSGTVGQQRINIDFVRNYPVPLPPLETQRRIVNRIESLFSKIDESITTCQMILTEIGSIRKSILQKAFCGEFA